MSYDNPKSMPSISARGRAARADEKDHDQDAESGLNASGGKPSANVAAQEQASVNGGGSVGSSSPSVGSGSRDRREPNSDDMDGLSSGNDSGERESEGGMERDNGSHGRQSVRSSHNSSNGKDSGMMLGHTESNKR